MTEDQKPQTKGIAPNGSHSIDIHKYYESNIALEKRLGSIDKEIFALKEAIKSLATRDELKEMENSMLKWFIGIVVSVIILSIGALNIIGYFRTS